MDIDALNELEAEQDQPGDIEEETAAVEVAEETPPAPPKPMGEPMKTRESKRRRRRPCGC